MAGRTSAEAVSSYVEPLRKVLSCVTQEVVQVGGGYHPADQPHVLIVANGNPVRLKGGKRVTLSVLQRYRVIEEVGEREPWRVSTAAYLYALGVDGGPEILGYHWHPFSGAAFPHVHLGAGSGVNREELQKAHLPTGRIALEQVVRLAIADFDAEPLRPDWDEVLVEAQERFEEHRSWS